MLERSLRERREGTALISNRPKHCMNVAFSKHSCFRKRGRGSISLVVVNVLDGQSVFFPFDSAHLIVLSLRLCKPLGSTGKKRRKIKNCFAFAKQHAWSRPQEYQCTRQKHRVTETALAWCSSLSQPSHVI